MNSELLSYYNDGSGWDAIYFKCDEGNLGHLFHMAKQVYLIALVTIGDEKESSYSPECIRRMILLLKRK